MGYLKAVDRGQRDFRLVENSTCIAAWSVAVNKEDSKKEYEIFLSELALVSLALNQVLYAAHAEIEYGSGLKICREEYRRRHPK